MNHQHTSYGYRCIELWLGYYAHAQLLIKWTVPVRQLSRGHY